MNNHGLPETCLCKGTRSALIERAGPWRHSNSCNVSRSARSLAALAHVLRSPNEDNNDDDSQFWASYLIDVQSTLAPCEQAGYYLTSCLSPLGPILATCCPSWDPVWLHFRSWEGSPILLSLLVSVLLLFGSTGPLFNLRKLNRKVHKVFSKF